MISIRRPLVVPGLSTLLVAAGLASACGDSSTNSTPPAAAAGEAGSRASGNAGEGNPGSGGSNGNVAGAGGEAAVVGVAGQGQGDAGEGTGGGEQGPRCEEASFAVDCPARECQLVSGCEQHACQYTPLKVCASRLSTGTFVGGIVDGKQGDLTLHGNLAPFRRADGPTCVGTTCLTGGLAP